MAPTNLYVPDDFDWDRIMRISSASIASSSRYRRDACFDDPLLFALIYMPHHLRSPETRNKISLNRFHLDICDDAIEIAAHGPYAPGEKRDCYVGPREVGKSTWGTLIRPLWFAAYNYRRFIAMYSDSGDQARLLLDALLLEMFGATDDDSLQGRKWFQEDFPDLCTPRVEKGGDTATMYRSKSKVAFMAKGIDAKTLGAKAGNVRPDMIILDDIEPPGEKNYSEEARQARQDTIVNAIFPMNQNAVVTVLGTAVRYASIIHNFVRHSIGELVSSFVIDENIDVHYYPAIVRDDDGRERSFWPERWSIEWLQKERRKRSFNLMYMNNPITATVDDETGVAKGEYWEESDFDYRTPWIVHDGVLVLDPAVTAKSTSDFTGIAIVSTNAAENRVCIEEATGVRYRTKALKEYIADTLKLNPFISHVLLETNQGGMWVAEAIKGVIPRGVRFWTIHETNSKKFRVREFLWYDDEGWVTYREKFPALHAQQINFSNTPHDDIVDAAAKGAHFWLKDDKAAMNRR